VHFLLQEIDRNIPTKHIRKWNILDAMISVAWESIMPTAIQNCFAKCGFSTASSVNTDNDEENCKLVELQGHSNCPSTFDQFLNVDKSVPNTADQPVSLEQPWP
jgi:hypothetical protein